MARPVLVSLLWPKNAHVLGSLMQNYGFDIAVPENSVPDILKEIAAAAGARVLPLSIGVTAETASRATAVPSLLATHLGAYVAAEPALERYDRTAIAASIEQALSTRLLDGMAFVDSLDALRGREQIAGLLVNETDLMAAKTAALWAREHHIPSFLLSHGTNIGAAYTITNQMLADFLLVFGERGMEPYLDMGIPADRMVVTGNPAWDGYNQILASRDDYKDAVYKQLGLVAGAPLIVFATTWNAKLTALQDADIYENTVRSFVKACRDLQSRGVVCNAIVKDRPSNSAFGRGTVERIAAEEGVTGLKYADGDMPVFLCAADVLVGYDSNAFVEAMICKVPSVGIWDPSSWLLGPALDRREAIPLAQGDNPSGLADVLQKLLTDDGANAAVVAEQSSRLDYFHAGNDGRAGERSAAAIAERIKTFAGAPLPVQTNGQLSVQAPPQRPAWMELTNPRSVAEKGGTQEYYDHPRHELINLLDHSPRMVLDIGCAGGATALELKKLHPGAIVHGIELSEEAAELAATRMDRILRENVEQMDFSSFGYKHGGIDVVFLPDVLEHLYNPWQLLVKLKPFLSSDAQVLASIPNARNAWLVTQLIGGKWDYVEEGLLDVTHIRFFTLKSVIELFGQTGYSIERIGQNIDGRMPAVDVPEGGVISFDMGGATFKNMTAQDVWELRTFQFLVDAKPA